VKIARTIDEVRSAAASARAAGLLIGFVPTMGYLHEGHLSLVDLVKENGATFTVVSIFVNPTQFAPHEDLASYPRDEARDVSLLESRNVDLLFAPDASEIYPSGFTTRIDAGAVSRPLEGERRPGHFDGVATVVLKLLLIVQPDLAAFGRKDAQQCAVVQRMVTDLSVPVRLLFGETVREDDKVAMSSRNSYLSPAERQLAPALHRSLRAGENALVHGIADIEAVETLMRRTAEEGGGTEVDYLRLVDPETFLPPADFDRDLLLVGALRLGRTRLIDNITVARHQIPSTRRTTGGSPNADDTTTKFTAPGQLEVQR
jgi:pantoate--beta-alanine ligase